MTEKGATARDIVKAAVSAVRIATDLGLGSSSQVGPILAIHLLAGLKKRGLRIVRRAH